MQSRSPEREIPYIVGEHQMCAPLPSLYAYRTLANLSRRALARKALVSDAAISRIERGRWSNAATRECLANALGVGVTELMSKPSSSLREKVRHQPVLCPKGHEVEGRDANGLCSKCRREYELRRARRHGAQPNLTLPRLREIREMRGMGSGELARKAGVHRHTVYAVEGGDSARYRTYIALAGALDVDVRQLVAVEDVVKVGSAS